jgi:2-oxoglutarate ferredoxin oxidoreductase subunit alpha
MTPDRFSIAVTGSGGSGVISCGELLLRSWAGSGGRGFLRKAFGPQIRGGEAAALLSLTAGERYTAAPEYDLLVALDWLNFSRFEDEIRLASNALVVCESASAAPGWLEDVRFLELPISALAAEAHVDGRANMLALGLLGASLGLPVEALCEQAVSRLAGKHSVYLDAARAAIAAGASHSLDITARLPARGEPGPWCLSGNQAAGYGALDAGVRFVAAYPITPASDLLEWMATPLEALGGCLLQAEDELAAINMALGAAFGGVPAFTATSGPGLALMAESIGLAVASETPVCIFNVQRGGPSTGIPTKSEQSDLDIALHGLHGDAPHLVLAPLSIEDCVYTTSLAVHLAQALQAPSIVLSDQFLGQSTAVISEPRRFLPGPVAALPGPTGEYLRYRLTESGISSLAFPGDANMRYTADGLEHNENGTPSASQSDHQEQLDKRLRKLTRYDFGEDWAEIAGEGELALVAFGSTAAVISEAAAVLAAEGVPVTTVALRLLSPLPITKLTAALTGTKCVVVVEQNHGAQLFAYLRSQLDAEFRLDSYALPGPVPLNPFQLAQYLREVQNS